MHAWVGLGDALQTLRTGRTMKVYLGGDQESAGFMDSVYSISGIGNKLPRGALQAA